jgi:hypothetical protein
MGVLNLQRGLTNSRGCEEDSNDKCHDSGDPVT